MNEKYALLQKTCNPSAKMRGLNKASFQIIEETTWGLLKWGYSESANGAWGEIKEALPALQSEVNGGISDVLSDDPRDGGAQKDPKSCEADYDCPQLTYCKQPPGICVQYFYPQCLGDLDCYVDDEEMDDLWQKNFCYSLIDDDSIECGTCMQYPICKSDFNCYPEEEVCSLMFDDGLGTCVRRDEESSEESRLQPLPCIGFEEPVTGTLVVSRESVSTTQTVLYGSVDSNEAKRYLIGEKRFTGLNQNEFEGTLRTMISGPDDDESGNAAFKATAYIEVSISGSKTPEKSNNWLTLEAEYEVKDTQRLTADAIWCPIRVTVPVYTVDGEILSQILLDYTVTEEQGYYTEKKGNSYWLKTLSGTSYYDNKEVYPEEIQINDYGLFLNENQEKYKLFFNEEKNKNVVWDSENGVEVMELPADVNALPILCDENECYFKEQASLLTTRKK